MVQPPTPTKKGKHWEKNQERSVCVSVLVTQSWPTLCYPWIVAHQAPLGFSGKNTGVGYHSLLQGIFLTQRLNLGLLYCRKIL